MNQEDLIDIKTRAYQEIGKLFFAVAFADKKIHANEVKQLQETYRKAWLHKDHTADEYGEEATHQIEIVFDYLLDEHEEINSMDILDEFQEFKEAHPSFFTSSLKKRILNSAIAIADSYAGVNKSELVTIAKISEILKS
jgi:hypothetical protein